MPAYRQRGGKGNKQKVPRLPVASKGCRPWQNSILHNGKIYKDLLVAVSAAEILMPAIHHAGAAFTNHAVMDMLGFDHLAAKLALCGIFDNFGHVKPSFVFYHYSTTPAVWQAFLRGCAMLCLTRKVNFGILVTHPATCVTE